MRTAIICFCLAAYTVAGAQDPIRAAAEKHITAEAVKPLIVELASDEYEGRGGGYPGEKAAADYIAKEYEKLGLKPAGDVVRGKRTFFQEFSFMVHRPLVPWEKRRSRNVVALLEGSDPILKNEIVVIGAHYDGQGRLGQADAGPRTAPKEPGDPIWNSANDNISSVSAVLGVARAFKESKLPVKRSVLFIAFGAEEHTVAGSMFYVNKPSFELSRHVAMINLECVGRMPDKPMNLNAFWTGAFWLDLLKATNEQMGTSVQQNVPPPIPDSDHYPFASSRIPTVMLIGGWDPDRHLPSDTADKIDFARVAEAGRFAFGFVADLANRAERPKFVQNPMPDLGVIANIATSAECDSIGLAPSQGCCRVTGIIPNRPGARAGLKVGDAILGVADFNIPRDFTIAQAEKMLEDILRGRKGKEVKVTILRNKKQMELILPVTPN